MDGSEGENGGGGTAAVQPPALSKSARKKLLKRERLEARKAERKAAEKERKKANLERRRREWDERLEATPEEERERLLDARRETRKERMGQRTGEREARTARLRLARETGPKVVLDLEFAELMASNEINSLVHQIMYCYAVNGRCTSPADLWLTGCRGEIDSQLQRIPGYDKWMIGKEYKSYIEAFTREREILVYLTADAEEVLNDLDPKKVYIIGGLVDRNRWKGITLKKASEQGIQSARLLIGNYLKMSSSQVLTVNQVVEILLKFSETKDWRAAFFQVIPQRKRGEAENNSEAAELLNGGDKADGGIKLALQDGDILENDEASANVTGEADGDDGASKKTIQIEDEPTSMHMDGSLKQVLQDGGTEKNGDDQAAAIAGDAVGGDDDDNGLRKKQRIEIDDKRPS